jgi:hypothetical protein
MTVNTLQMGDPDSPPPRNTISGSRGRPLRIGILARKLGIQAVHRGLSPLCRDAGLEARGRHQPSHAAIALTVAMQIWCDPNVGAPRSQPAVKRRRRDAGDGEGFAIDPDGLAGNGQIAQEPVAPEPVTDYGERA